MSKEKRKELEIKNEALYSYLKEMPEDLNIDVEKEKRTFFSTIEKRKRRTRINSFLKVAAVVVLIITSGYYLTKEKAMSKQELVFDNNIEIGTDKAMLTLDDGSIVVLEKGGSFNQSNAKSDGKKIIYSSQDESEITLVDEKITYNYLTIPRGGQFYVKLADGTEVWLNSETKLKYPTKFISGKPRKVELIYGEAYFDVSPSTAHLGSTFEVLTNNQTLEVLGTEFNVKAYKDDFNIATTLVEGKVAVTVADKTEVLAPSQQMNVDKINGEISIESVDSDYEVAWRKGYFNFANKSFKDVSEVLERWYDVEFAFGNDEISNLKITGVLNKDQNIEYILITLKNIKNITYEIKEKTIYIN